jgi:hypothetical protein
MFGRSIHPEIRGTLNVGVLHGKFCSSPSRHLDHNNSDVPKEGKRSVALVAGETLIQSKCQILK